MDTVSKRIRRLLASLALLGIGASVPAQTMPVYSSATLENAWNNWSWAQTNLDSTQYTYQGQPTAEVTYANAWDGFYLSSSFSFPTQYFSSLSFEINGGATAGRSISFAAVVNGSGVKSLNLNNYISGGKVPANGWAKATVPVAAMGVPAGEFITGFWLQESSGAPQPSFWVTNFIWNAGTPPSATDITVTTNGMLRSVDQKHLGANTAVWDSGLDSPQCEQLIANTGFKAFRFPGGSLSDDYNWATNTTDSNTWTWATDFDQFASVAGFTRGQCFITANYGTGTPAEAASWVQYSNVTKNYGMKFWEIGNEEYGGWETDNHTNPHDPVTYANEFAQYYSQMKAVDSTIKVGAVITPGEDSYVNYPSEVVTNPVTGQPHSGWTPVLLSTLAGLGATPDFVIYHRYLEYNNDCDFTLLTSNGGWESDISNMRMMLNDYLGSAGTGVQIMNTECNCDAAPPGKQLCSLVNGLYMADCFGTVTQTECNSFMWWDLINGQNYSGDNGAWLYGWREYGDEGVMSPDFTQTYPVFYVERLLNYFAAASDSVLPTSSTYGLLTAYGTKRADGSVRLLVVNKNPSLTIPAKITLSGYTPAATATEYQYGITQDNAAEKGQSQAIAQTTLKNVSVNTNTTFPPYSVTVIVFSAKNPKK